VRRHGAYGPQRSWLAGRRHLDQLLIGHGPDGP
jgi:hypothetical protein